MADWMSKRSGGRIRRSMRDVDDDEFEFEEGDVWSVVREDSSSCRSKMKIINNKSMDHHSSASSAWHHHSAPKMIPSANTTTPTSLQQSSAPMNIPDWSKIYGNHHNHEDDQDYDGDGDDDDDDDMVPPHEWVARKLAGTQISSFSMCEGIGRTLKGRDLSKVRNAVLTKTGFLE